MGSAVAALHPFSIARSMRFTESSPLQDPPLEAAPKDPVDAMQAAERDRMVPAYHQLSKGFAQRGMAG